jgi:hypothetical protein
MSDLEKAKAYLAVQVRADARTALGWAATYLAELIEADTMGTAPIHQRALERIRRAVEDLDMGARLEAMKTEDLKALTGWICSRCGQPVAAYGEQTAHDVCRACEGPEGDR